MRALIKTLILTGLSVLLAGCGGFWMPSGGTVAFEISGLPASARSVDATVTGSGLSKPYVSGIACTAPVPSAGIWMGGMPVGPKSAHIVVRDAAEAVLMEVSKEFIMEDHVTLRIKIDLSQ